MQGVILSAGRAQSLVLGDDGARYTFTPLEWESDEVRPEVGLRVDFEVQGSRAASVKLVPGATPMPPVIYPPAAPPMAASVPMPQPPAVPPAATDIPPVQPAASSSTKNRFEIRLDKVRRWHWVAGAGVLIVLGVIGAILLGIFPAFGPPTGKEIARQTLNGETYTLVEYRDELAIFSDSGAPVTRQDAAEDILHSYAWRQVIGDFDVEKMGDISRNVRRLGDSVSGVRDFTNGVVDILDSLDSMAMDVPLLGRVSAMDVVRESFSGVEEAEFLMRSLNSELDDLDEKSDRLSWASRGIAELNLSSVSGEEAKSLFSDAANAARDLKAPVRSAKELVSDIIEVVGALDSALGSVSYDLEIGDGRSVGGYESDLSEFSRQMEGLESELADLEEDMREALDSADKTLRDDMKRWLSEPYDPEWPPADPERRTDVEELSRPVASGTETTRDT